MLTFNELLVYIDCVLLLYVQGAAGVGKAVADWITNGRASGNYLQFELARFTSLHNNPR